MGKKHKESIETFREIWVAVWFEELEAEICRGKRLAQAPPMRNDMQDRPDEHVNTGDSRSCTSLSI